MKAYSVCPVSGRMCIENKCAWWLEIAGKSGCAIRALGALITVLEQGMHIQGTINQR
jgi:hypothetical protein